MKFLQKYFWVIVLASIALGFIWPEPGLYLKPYLLYTLMLMMGLSCLKIDVKQLKHVSKDWWRYLVLLAQVFLLPTFIAFFFQGVLEKDIFIGLIIASAAPAAAATVFTSDLLGGESAKALVASTLTYLVSPIVMPLVVLLFASQVIKVDFWAMVLLVTQVMILPLAIAQIVRRFKFHEIIIPKIMIINTLLLVILTWGIIAPTRDLILKNPAQVMILFGVVAVIVLVEIILSIWFGRTKKEDITWSVVDTFKSYTLSSVIALSLFGPLAVLGSVVYSIVDNLAIVGLNWWFKRRR